MKKFNFILGVLLLFGLFNACSSDDDIENSTKDSFIEDSKNTEKVLIPIEEGEGFAALSDFFNSELSFSTYSKSFFGGYSGNEKTGDEVCIIINSRKDLEEIYSGEKELPEIDFQQYTLVVGYVMMPAGGYKCVKQELVSTTMASNSILNLYVEDIYEYNPCVITPLYFWGLYPKTYLSSIISNIILL